MNCTILKINLVLLFLLLFQIKANCQQLKFNNESVDTIIIKSNRYSYQFDDKGTTKGEGDIIYIRFDKKTKQYIIHKFYKSIYKSTYRPRKFKQVEKKFKSEVGKIVETEKIQGLLNSLANTQKPQSLIKQIDTIEFKRKINESEIYKIAKEYKVEYKLEKEYRTEEEIRNIIENGQSIETLKEYFIDRFDKDGYIVITDYSNTFNIWIRTIKSEYRFEGKYPNPIKQPWYYHNKITNKIENILNLDINNSLYTLLSNNFFLKETISNEALFHDYIVWFLKRRHIIWIN